MDIYVGHSSSIEYRENLYKPFKDSNLDNEYNLVFPHEDSEEPFDSKSFLKNKCDLFIADVSGASTGLGVELGWADLYNVPVVCIYRKDADISGSLSVLDAEMLEYEDTEDLVESLPKAIKKISGEKDFVVRTDYSTELENRIQLKADNKQKLGEIRDRFYKPNGTELADFSPRDTIVRKRKFPEEETLVKINIIQKPTGYTDTKEDVDSLDSYEKWGEFTSSAVEYTLTLGNKEAPILIETFDFGRYIKIESPSPEILDDILRKLELDRDDIIEKNSAELLAEDMNLI